MIEPQDYTKMSSGQRRRLRGIYVIHQRGLCCHCSEPLHLDPKKEVQEASIKEYLFPPGFFTRPIHLHHDHKTGMTIGAVHARCNAWLWQFKGE